MERGRGGWQMAAWVVISIVPPVFPEPPTQHSNLFGVIGAAIQIWLLPAGKGVSLEGPSDVGRQV